VRRPFKPVLNAEHAKQHGIREVTPELKAKVKAAIRDEK
jgi:hypothetical protein